LQAGKVSIAGLEIPLAKEGHGLGNPKIRFCVRKMEHKGEFELGIRPEVKKQQQHSQRKAGPNTEGFDCARLWQKKEKRLVPTNLSGSGSQHHSFAR
jgi:hypothetical protein